MEVAPKTCANCKSIHIRRKETYAGKITFETKITVGLGTSEWDPVSKKVTVWLKQPKQGNEHGQSTGHRPFSSLEFPWYIIRQRRKVSNHIERILTIQQKTCPKHDAT